jgi:hypothetical protein
VIDVRNELNLYIWLILRAAIKDLKVCILTMMIHVLTLTQIRSYDLALLTLTEAAASLYFSAFLSTTANYVKVGTKRIHTGNYFWFL